MTYKHNLNFDREAISIESGNWAKQADGSVVHRVGNLVMLATVCAVDESKEGQDFFLSLVNTLKRCILLEEFLADTSSEKANLPNTKYYSLAS